MEHMRGSSLVPSLSNPQIFIACSMKNRASDKNLGVGNAGYEDKGKNILTNYGCFNFSNCCDFKSIFLHVCTYLCHIHYCFQYGVVSTETHHVARLCSTYKVACDT